MITDSFFCIETFFFNVATGNQRSHDKDHKLDDLQISQDLPCYYENMALF